jgi:hypothetical protein
MKTDITTEEMSMLLMMVARNKSKKQEITKFTCFTSAEVKILTLTRLARWRATAGRIFLWYVSLSYVSRSSLISSVCLY